MIQASLNTYCLLILLRFFKSLLRCHAKEVALIKVDDYNVKHRGSPLLSEAMGSCVSPQVFRYHYLTRPPPQFNHSVSSKTISPVPLGFSVNVLPP